MFLSRSFTLAYCIPPAKWGSIRQTKLSIFGLKCCCGRHNLHWKKQVIIIISEVNLHQERFLSDCGPPSASSHSFPGSAAGAAALKSGDAVRWWLLSIALATRGRAGAADPPLKSFSLLGFSRFWGFGVGEKRVKFADAFWRSSLGVFWSVFGQFFIIFWYCPRVKIV